MVRRSLIRMGFASVSGCQQIISSQLLRMLYANIWGTFTASSLTCTHTLNALCAGCPFSLPHEGLQQKDPAQLVHRLATLAGRQPHTYTNVWYLCGGFGAMLCDVHWRYVPVVCHEMRCLGMCFS